MGLVVNHNIPALSAFNAVTKTGNALQKSIQKLSTGLRINSAADDAAGLAISEKMRAQVRGLDRAVANSQDGISMIQTAEGALNETHSILQRMRELSVQAANDTLTQQDRRYIQDEIDQLREEITRIGNTTQFNKKKLLNGDAAVLWSSDNLKTKALINGGLRQVDQFGQKRAVEGNYKINIKAEAGQAEVKKTDIFKIKHDGVLMGVQVNRKNGVNTVRADNLPAGTYNVDAVAGPTASKATLTGLYGVATSVDVGDIVLAGPNAIDAAAAAGYQNKQLKFDVDGVETAIQLDNTAFANAAALAANIKGKLQAAGGIWDGVDVTADGSNKISIKLTGKPQVQIKAKAGDDAEGIFGTGTSTWSKTGTSNLNFEQDILKATPADDPTQNANVLFEVTNVNAAAKSVTFKMTANAIDAKGNISTTTQEITLTEGAANAKGILDTMLGTDKVKLELKDGMAVRFKKGDKFVYNVTSKADADVGVSVKGTANEKWGGSWGSITDKDVVYGLKKADIKDKDLHFKNFYLNSKTGKVYEGDIILRTNKKDIDAGQSLAGFEVGFVGQVAKKDVKLSDLDKFWDPQGRFMLKDAQTLTLTQGDGKQTKVTLYANDTLEDVARRINNAISEGLGQGAYIGTGQPGDKFAVFVNQDGAAGPETVAGTIVIRSLIPGSTGRLNFAGDEDVIKALSLNVLQDAKESDYTIDVTDAHTGKKITDEPVKTTGNRLIGAVHPNVDVEFDAMAGVTAKWDNVSQSFVYESKDYTTILHLADNTTVFQIGANEGEDMGVNIGDMRSHALGLNEVLVTDRTSAARSITVIDNALDKVSTQRAKLGAYQNRLEHTVNNLMVASENLTASESRIRDTDMAKEMMNFTKLNIMLQAGNAMLAQANQLPQNVLSLIR